MTFGIDVGFSFLVWFGFGLVCFPVNAEGPIVHVCTLVNFMNAVSSRGPAWDIQACKVWALQKEE